MIIDNLDTGHRYDTDSPNPADWPPHLDPLWDPVTRGFVQVDLSDPAASFSALQRFVGQQPMPPEKTDGTDLVPIKVAGPGSTPGGLGPVLLDSFLFDPLPGQKLTADQTQYNTEMTAYAARLTALTEQWKLLAQHKASAPLAPRAPVA